MDPVTIVIDAGALEAMRIDITGCPAHAFECLVELASRSVPVTLFSCSGKLRAQLFNPLPKPTALAHWIGDLIGTGEASQPYRAWVEHHVRRLLRAAGLHGGNLEAQCLEHDRLLDMLVENSGLRVEYDAYLGGLEPMLQARIAEHLLRFGVVPGGPAHRRLAVDLELLARRWLCAKAIDWLARLADEDEIRKFERFLRAVGSIELDGWLSLVLGRLNETAVSHALHRDGID